MRIKQTSVYVDDQEKALHFYTKVVGFVKKADFSQASYRWLTVVSPERKFALFTEQWQRLIPDGQFPLQMREAMEHRRSS